MIIQLDPKNSRAAKEQENIQKVRARRNGEMEKLK